MSKEHFEGVAKPQIKIARELMHRTIGTSHCQQSVDIDPLGKVSVHLLAVRLAASGFSGIAVPEGRNLLLTQHGKPCPPHGGAIERFRKTTDLLRVVPGAPRRRHAAERVIV